MSFLVLYFVILVLEASCAPIEGEEEAKNEEIVTENGSDFENSRIAKEENFQARDNEKNPVQEFFENLSKNASTNAQNAMNTIKDWITNVAQNNNKNNPVQNLPTMYMGSFQLLKMPMPQITDVMKGIGDLATLAQTFNKVTGGGGLPQLPQNIPLVSQG